MTPVNPNSPSYPYSGGTDNPGDDTSIAGGPTSVASVETAPFQPVPHAAGIASLNGIVPPVVAGIAQTGTDTNLGGLQAVPPSASGFESLVDRGADPEGGTDPAGGAREAGQDEVAGATETTSGVTPVAFPEPTP